MVTAYWSIGQLIVEHEQKGGKRAEYGKAVLDGLSERLTADFGKGFDARNLRNMRKFYLLFPIWNTVRTKLTWSHYRSLLRVENEQARAWYVQEAVSEQWSSRQLDRQISTLYMNVYCQAKKLRPLRRRQPKNLQKCPPNGLLKTFTFLNFSI